jgi:hypothetical protein
MVQMVKQGPNNLQQMYCLSTLEKKNPRDILPIKVKMTNKKVDMPMRKQFVSKTSAAVTLEGYLWQSCHISLTINMTEKSRLMVDLSIIIIYVLN